MCCFSISENRRIGKRTIAINHPTTRFESDAALDCSPSFAYESVSCDQTPDLCHEIHSILGASQRPAADLSPDKCVIACDCFECQKRPVIAFTETFVSLSDCNRYTIHVRRQFARKITATEDDLRVLNESTSISIFRRSAKEKRKVKRVALMADRRRLALPLFRRADEIASFNCTLRLMQL